MTLVHSILALILLFAMASCLPQGGAVEVKKVAHKHEEHSGANAAANKDCEKHTDLNLKPSVSPSSKVSPPAKLTEEKHTEGEEHTEHADEADHDDCED